MTSGPFSSAARDPELFRRTLQRLILSMAGRPESLSQPRAELEGLPGGLATSRCEETFSPPRYVLSAPAQPDNETLTVSPPPPAESGPSVTQVFTDSAGNEWAADGTWSRKYATDRPTLAAQFKIRPARWLNSIPTPPQDSEIERMSDAQVWVTSDLAAGTGWVQLLLPPGGSEHDGWDAGIPFDIAVRGLGPESHLVLTTYYRVTGALGCSAFPYKFTNDGAAYLVVHDESAGMAVLASQLYDGTPGAVCSNYPASGNGATSARIETNPQDVQILHFAADPNGGWWMFSTGTGFSGPAIPSFARRVTYASGVITVGAEIYFSDPNGDADPLPPLPYRYGEPPRLVHAVYRTT